MKKYFNVFLIAAFALLISASVASAETTSVKKAEKPEPAKTGKLQTLKQEVKEVKETVKADIEKIRTEAKVKMQALRSDIANEKDEAKAKIKNDRLVGRAKALDRFDQIIAQVTNLKDRLNARIAKIDATGTDTSAAKAFVATAQTKLDDAKAKVVEIDTLLTNSIDQISKNDKTKLKTLTQEAQSLVKDAHNALKDAVKSLKGEKTGEGDNKVENGKTATTTDNGGSNQ